MRSILTFKHKFPYLLQRLHKPAVPTVTRLRTPLALRAGALSTMFKLKSYLGEGTDAQLNAFTSVAMAQMTESKSKQPYIP